MKSILFIRTSILFIYEKVGFRDENSEAFGAFVKRRKAEDPYLIQAIHD